MWGRVKDHPAFCSKKLYGEFKNITGGYSAEALRIHSLPIMILQNEGPHVWRFGRMKTVPELPHVGAIRFFEG